MSEDQDKVIELLAKNEEAVEQLYRAYATKYPRQESFWLELAGEELKHATMLRNFELELRNKPEHVLFKPGRFEPEAVQSSVKYVERLVKEAPEKDYPLTTALSLAMQLEQSLIEKKYFEVCEGDDFEFQKTINALRVDTERHYEKVKGAWQREKERRKGSSMLD